MRCRVPAAVLFLAIAAPGYAQSLQPGIEAKPLDSKPLQGGAFAAPVTSVAPVAPPVPAAPAVGAQAAPAPEAAQSAAAPAPKKKVVKRDPPKERGIVSDDPRPSLTPETARLTSDAAAKYRAIADLGGWPSLPAGTRLTLGAKGAHVTALRERLAAEGDLENMAGTTFDKDVQEAVKQFQSRHGLARNGVVAGATLAALNVPAATRARQLEQSALRLSDRNFNFAGRYVVVNIPSASVEAVEGNLVKRRYVAVVGKPENASPQVDAKIGTVNINPTWTLPTSIIKNEIVPKMRKDPGYLTRANIRILDRSGNTVSPGAIDWNGNSAVNYTLRQDSGVRNALGQLRIDMPNRESVYMHDTPSKRFFASQDRFYSHGCVRVQDVRGFASWLLEETPGGWDKSTIDAAIAIGERKDVRLAKSVPVAWVYMTGYVSDDGKTHFRDDVYALDSGAGAQLAQAKRVQKQAAREAARNEITGSIPSAANSPVGTAPPRSIPATGTYATGQIIDPPVQESPRRGWLWW